MDRIVKVKSHKIYIFIIFMKYVQGGFFYRDTNQIKRTPEYLKKHLFSSNAVLIILKKAKEKVPSRKIRYQLFS